MIVPSGCDVCRLPIRCFRSRPLRVASLDETITQEKKPTTSWIERQLAEEQLESTPQQRWIVATSFVTNFCVVGRALSHVGSWQEATGAMVVMMGGYLTADLLSGIYHWGIDNYGSKDTPIFGNQIDGFQRHHRYPWTITHRQFCNNIHPICIPAIPFSLLLLLTHPGMLWELWASVGCLVVVLSQQCHAWAHTKRKDLPEWVKQLQDSGVVVSQSMHCQHHRHPFDDNYCIVSGIWNSVLDKSGVFGRAERWIYARTGIRPRSWDETPTTRVAYYDD